MGNAPSGASGEGAPAESTVEAVPEVLTPVDDEAMSKTTQELLEVDIANIEAKLIPQRTFLYRFLENRNCGIICELRRLE